MPNTKLIIFLMFSVIIVFSAVNAASYDYILKEFCPSQSGGFCDWPPANADSKLNTNDNIAVEITNSQAVYVSIFQSMPELYNKAIKIRIKALPDTISSQFLVTNPDNIEEGNFVIKLAAETASLNYQDFCVPISHYILIPVFRISSASSSSHFAIDSITLENAATCSPTIIDDLDLKPKKIAVIQSVENPDSNANGKIDLVGGKPVMVRVFVDFFSEKADVIEKVPVKLEIYEKGKAEAVWSDVAMQNIQKNYYPFLLKAGHDSFNFFPTSALNIWKPEKGKKYVFKATVNPDKKIGELFFTNNDLSIEAETGAETKTVIVAGIVDNVNPAGQELKKINMTDAKITFINNLVFLNKIYPLSSNDISTRFYDTAFNEIYATSLTKEKVLNLALARAQSVYDEIRRVNNAETDIIVLSIVPFNIIPETSYGVYRKDSIILIADSNERGVILANKYGEFLGLKPEEATKTYPIARLAGNGWELIQERGKFYGISLGPVINVYNQAHDYFEPDGAFKLLYEYAPEERNPDKKLGPRYFNMKDTIILGVRNAWISQNAYEDLTKKLVKF